MDVSFERERGGTVRQDCVRSAAILAAYFIIKRAPIAIAIEVDGQSNCEVFETQYDNAHVRTAIYFGTISVRT